MAIKGKGKTKARPVARAPRREPVEVKPPFFMRRWVQVGLAFVAGMAVVMLVVWVKDGLRQQRANNTTKTQASEQRTAGQKWQAELEGAIGKLGTITPGTPTPPTIFAPVGDTIGALTSGKTPPKGAAGGLKNAQGQAQTTADALQKFDLTGTIRDKGFDVGTTNYFLNSQKLIAQSLQLYKQAAALAALALDATGAQQKALARQAAATKASADALFQEGWFDYQQALFDAHIVQTPLGGGVSGLPGGS
jgi:hypothetical protein